MRLWNVSNSWFEKWKDKPNRNRGADYMEFKEKLTKHLLDILYERYVLNNKICHLFQKAFFVANGFFGGGILNTVSLKFVVRLSFITWAPL